MNKAIQKIEYKWIVVAASFLMVFVTLGFCSSTKSLYLSSVTETLGIKRSLFSVSDSFRFITTAVINVFFGALVTKFGTRKMVAAGFGSLIVFALISAFAANVYAFYAAGIFLGLGLSWTTTTMVGHVVNGWCKEHKGTIMGFILAANGVGGALATQILSPIINNPKDVYGYRTAYLTTALILLIAGSVVVVLFKNAPSQKKLEDKALKVSEGTLSNKVGICTPVFCFTAVAIFFTGLVLQGMNSMAVAHMKDIGLDSAYVATVFSIYSLLLAGSKFLSGVLHDKIGLKKTILICDAAAVASPLLLLFLAPTLAGKTLAVVFCFAFAAAVPLETVMLPLIVLGVLGEQSYVKGLGIFVSVNTAGYALGSPLVNLCFDLSGNYELALIIMCGLMAVITFLFQIVLKRVKA